MAANEGFFELEADDNAKLRTVLAAHPAVDKLAAEVNKVLVYLKTDLKASDLNQYLFQNGITLNHLVKRKNSLEEQFLALTKK